MLSPFVSTIRSICYALARLLYNPVAAQTFTGSLFAVHCNEGISALFVQSCHHKSLFYLESSSSYVVVPGSMVSVCIKSAFIKNFCTASFVPCHHVVAIIMARLS